MERRYECYCDMRGMLSFLILFMLSKKSMHGQEIANELKKRRGTKPSPGTVYPALKYLKNMGLVKSQKVKKEISYSLTPAGKRELGRASGYFYKMFYDVIEKR